MDRLEFGGPKEGFEVYSAKVLGWMPSGAHVKNKEPLDQATRPRAELCDQDQATRLFYSA